MSGHILIACATGNLPISALEGEYAVHSAWQLTPCPGSARRQSAVCPIVDSISSVFLKPEIQIFMYSLLIFLCWQLIRIFEKYFASQSPWAIISVDTFPSA